MSRLGLYLALVLLMSIGSSQPSVAEPQTVIQATYGDGSDQFSPTPLEGQQFAVSSQNVYIYDAEQQKIVCYDFGGKWLQTIDALFDPAEDMAATDNEIILLAERKVTIVGKDRADERHYELHVYRSGQWATYPIAADPELGFREISIGQKTIRTRTTGCLKLNVNPTSGDISIFDVGSRNSLVVRQNGVFLEPEAQRQTLVQKSSLGMTGMSAVAYEAGMILFKTSNPAEGTVLKLVDATGQVQASVLLPANALIPISNRLRLSPDSKSVYELRAYQDLTKGLAVVKYNLQFK